MCQPKPGPRCASDTCESATQTLEEYIRAWPGAGRVPVNPVAAAVAVFEQAGVERAELARALGLSPAVVPQPRPSLDGAERPPRRDFGPAHERPSGLNQPPIEAFGAVDPLRGPFLAERTWNVPDPSSDHVFVEGREFHRRTRDNWPEWPDGIRIEADRQLTNKEMRQMASLVGYGQRSHLRGAESLSPRIVRDGPNSFVVYQDATKTFSDDSGAAYDRFEEALPDLMREGSPVRKTDRAGVGTRGTRLLEGVPDVNISIWYDDVGWNPHAARAS